MKKTVNQGKLNPRYIDGRTLNKHYCFDCSREINYRAKRCRECHIESRKGFPVPWLINFSTKSENNGRYIDGRSLNTNYCMDCDKKLADYRATRCNPCAQKAFQKSLGHGKISYCKDCGKQLTKSKYVYCNKHNHSGERNHNWQNGKSFEPYPLGWTKTFKEQIRYRDGYKCQVCGVPETECRTRLHVHHIDYNKENLFLSNLISLCSSCHSKTNFRREYWEQYFKEKVI